MRREMTPTIVPSILIACDVDGVLSILHDTEANVAQKYLD